MLCNKKIQIKRENTYNLLLLFVSPEASTYMEKKPKMLLNN